MTSILELEEGEREQQRSESNQRRCAHRVSRSHLEAVGVGTSINALEQRDLIGHSENSHVNVSVAGCIQERKASDMDQQKQLMRFKHKTMTIKSKYHRRIKVLDACAHLTKNRLVIGAAPHGQGGCKGFGAIGISGARTRRQIL